jgi:cell division protein YceG involved in septum cleavage
MGTPTTLADLTTVKDDDLDNGPLGEGFVMQHASGAHTRGYTSHSPTDNSGSVATLQARANLSEYIVFPKTYSFPRTVRILAIVRKFINAFRKKWDPRYVAPFKPTLPI